jgi:hypothetical protein
MQVTVKIKYVTGDSVGSQRLSDRLAAAIPKFMFAPHSWHFVAVAPTSVPHAGHSFGLGFSFSLRKSPSNCFFH